MPANPVGPDLAADIMARDLFCCVRCGKFVMSGTRGWDWSVQHRVRGNRADVRMSNLIILCGSGTTMCHGWVTLHPFLALAAGWGVETCDRADTATIPVVYCQRQVQRVGRFLLSDDGGIRVAA